jgi:hypothetical protein
MGSIGMTARSHLRLVSQTTERRPPARRSAAERPAFAIDEERGHRGAGPVAALLFMLVLVGAGFLLTLKLRDMSHREDCLMQGRTNCAPIERPVQK